MKEPETAKEEEQKPRSNRLQKATAILLLALIVFVGIDGYFNKWSIVRTLANLNTLQLKDTSGKVWELTARQDFQILRVNDIRRIVNTDSLFAFDQPYRDAHFYRLYFRNSDSSSARLQRLYQTLLSVDSSQTIRHTVEDAERAYRNLQWILHPGQAVAPDSSGTVGRDSSKKISRGDLALGSGDETESVVRKYVSSPQVLLGAGLGIVASAGIDLLRGDAFVAYSKDDAFHLDSLSLGSQVGMWEGSPIDILWAFAPQDSLMDRKTEESRMTKDSSKTREDRERDTEKK